ncbi:LamG-like jellyroll fold domain-containing protein [Fontivita pretiosa]|uniref:LamG-like jellyroll fold domain-containing protein n=1 Tax=Fontivita pretiosa TaxID=2989684 RepID=UPI003D17E787
METLESRLLLAVGLVAAYGFEEGAGATTTADVSGNNNTGAVNGATWTTSGRFGNALSFNGTSNYVTVNDAASLDLSTGMTLEAWVFPTATTGVRDVIIKEGSNVDIYNLYARNWRGAPEANVFVGGINRTAEGPTLSANVWTHLAGTYDGVTLRLYINGAEAAALAVAGSIPASTGALRIGGNSIWGEFFQGIIDEVRIYNRALAPSEIQQDMNSPVSQGGSDTTSPAITAVTPRNGAANVALTTNITVTFNEPMDPASITSSTIVLRDPNANVVSASVTYNAATRVATLDPQNNLTSFPNAYYTAQVKGGVAGVKDISGNPLSADLTWAFTTGTPQFQDNIVFSGLIEPTTLRFSPDGRVFVAEKRGVIKVFDSLSDTTPTIFADLRTNVHNFWDRGLLGMTLAPNFPTDPYVYVLYTYDGDIGGPAPKYGQPNTDSDPGPNATTTGALVSGRLSRLRADGNVMVGPEQVLVHDWFQQFPSHSIGTVIFGPDGALYAGGGDGASFNYADYGQTGNPGNDPPNEGGALRSLDLRTPGDPTSLDGSIIRVDPATGAPLPDNPLFNTGNDTNARRIIAYGMRNPFRFAFRPGTSEIWVGDVGWSTWEEINRIRVPNDSTVENFGWPAYEGPGRQGGYDALNLPLIENLYNNAGAETQPFYAYNHNEQVVPGANEPTGGSAVAGLAFYTGGSYPLAYNGALFFCDEARDRIYVMYAGPSGEPDPANRAILPAVNSPVELQIGPGGDVFYVNLADGLVRRIQYAGATQTNRPPNAVIQANPTSGPAPLTVQFSAAGSSDPDPGDTISFAWDLDNDGQFDDATTATTSYTFTTGGNKTVRLRVTDSRGAFSDASTIIAVNNQPPQAFIDAPLSSLMYVTGQTINFSGHGSDPDDGTLPASALTWTLIQHHNTHTHTVQSYAGVASGSFIVPDHEYPSFLELSLTVTDSGGLQATTSVQLQPQTVVLNFLTSPPGLQLAVGSEQGTSPFGRTVIVGSSNTISAISPQVLNGTTYFFSSWSDGGAATHTVVAPSSTTTYTANFVTVSGPVLAFNFEEGSGGTVLDRSGNGNNGTISGASRTTSGRYGSGVSFTSNGQMITVLDSGSLDLTTGMTLEAWVYSTVANGVRDVIIKEGAGVDVYNLYWRNWRGRPEGNVLVGGVNQTAEGTSLPRNAWQHLATTYDGAVLRLYVNGSQVGSLPMSGPIATSDGALRIGGNTLWGEWFRGRIDEVRIYSRALSAAEIQTDMNTPIASGSPLLPNLPGPKALAGTALPPLPDSYSIFSESRIRSSDMIEEMSELTGLI